MVTDREQGGQEAGPRESGAQEPRHLEARRLEVGRIARAHGLRGDVIVKLTTDRVERVDVGSELYADGRALIVRSSRPHQQGFIVTFEGLNDRNAAEAMRGQPLEAESLEDDSVLWVHELIGTRVVELDGTDRGVIASIEANPASDLAVLESGALVPLTFVVDGPVDGIVTIDPPKGLFDV